MACITNCTACGKAYEEQSEESANDPSRLCLACFDTASNHAYECRCGVCTKWHKLVPPEAEDADRDMLGDDAAFFDGEVGNK